MSNINANELSVEYLSVIGLNPWAGHDSSSRQQMFSSHIAQRLVIKGASERRIQTGLEKEFGKYTFSVKMPVDGKIVKVIDRYPRSVAGDGVNAVVETLVIYEDEKTKELGCFTIPYYTSYHQYFGFDYKVKPAVSRLIPGSYIEKDTIFADSPTITEHGGYKYGIEMNMAFMSHPAVSEDGVLISSDALDRLKFKIYETRVVDFGSSHFPLNIYGTEHDYKPFPEIGEYVRDDGLLTVLRSYEQTLGPVETSIYDTMEPDFIFDKPVYVRSGVGKVVDMKVYHDDDDGSPTPMGIEKHLNKYVKGLKDYYQEILSVEKSIRAERRKKFGINKVDLKPELHRLIVEAMCHLDQGGQKASQKLNKLYRQTPLDDYRVEFVIEYEIMPDIGFKLTDGHGG